MLRKKEEGREGKKGGRKSPTYLQVLLTHLDLGAMTSHGVVDSLKPHTLSLQCVL